MFGGGEGAAPYKATALLVLNIFAPFLRKKPFLKDPRIRSTGLETGCKPVLFNLL